MGCDIHIYMEGKKTINKETKWVSMDLFELDPYEGSYDVLQIYRGRNYRLFSVLADVRNDTPGTPDYNEPICQPKGMPEDCCQTIKDQDKYWDGDGHSHSYFTLRELEEFAKDHNVINHSGMMHPDQAEKVDRGEIPNMWCKWTNASGYVYREWQEKINILEPIITAMRQRALDLYWWFLDENARPDDIRIVFWFDN